MIKNTCMRYGKGSGGIIGVKRCKIKISADLIQQFTSVYRLDYRTLGSKGTISSEEDKAQGRI